MRTGSIQKLTYDYHNPQVVSVPAIIPLQEKLTLKERALNIIENVATGFALAFFLLVFGLCSGLMIGLPFIYYAVTGLFMEF